MKSRWLRDMDGRLVRHTWDEREMGVNCGESQTCLLNSTANSVIAAKW